MALGMNRKKPKFLQIAFVKFVEWYYSLNHKGFPITRLVKNNGNRL
jgi:hypothetical protein